MLVRVCSRFESMCALRGEAFARPRESTMYVGDFWRHVTVSRVCISCFGTWRAGLVVEEGLAVSAARPPTTLVLYTHFSPWEWGTSSGNRLYIGRSSREVLRAQHSTACLACGLPTDLCPAAPSADTCNVCASPLSTVSGVWSDDGSHLNAETWNPHDAPRPISDP